MSHEVYRVVYRTEEGRTGAVLLIALSPADAVRKARARDSILKNAPRVVATATSEIVRNSWA